jgi:hypothetical protein
VLRRRTYSYHGTGTRRERLPGNGSFLNKSRLRTTREPPSMLRKEPLKNQKPSPQNQQLFSLELLRIDATSPLPFSSNFLSVISNGPIVFRTLLRICIVAKLILPQNIDIKSIYLLQCRTCLKFEKWAVSMRKEPLNFETKTKTGWRQR